MNNLLDVYKIVVLGEARTGKTALINSILGEDLLSLLKNPSTVSY